MSTTFFYPYPTLVKGILRKRYKRFLAEIELESGEMITAHCANTGPMTDVYLRDHPVLISRSDNPQRKLAYTWEAILIKEQLPVWVGVNTSLPNRVIKKALADHLWPDLAGKGDRVRSEVAYSNNSRVDFYIERGDRPPLYLEVKNTTWCRGEIALFPDTVTTRGEKHLRDLMGVLPEAKAAVLFFINRGDCPYFSPGDAASPSYGKLLREAVNQGVMVLPYRFEVTPEGLHYLGLAELLI